MKTPSKSAWLAIGTAFFLLARGAVADPQPLYLDPAQPVDSRVADLVGRMTLDEKGMLLDHMGPDIARFGIHSDKWNQCLHGVWWDRPTTLFPVPIALAATWDPALIHTDADAISDEARGIYNLWHQQPDLKAEHKGLIYRAPVINISRNPYWGRINECYGEDPFLTGRIGVAYVQGLQGSDPHYLKLAATLKHYAVNNVEQDRQKLSATVSERMLHEYWLPHFRDCVVEGQAQSVMASYNAINGVPLAVNHLMLTDILKDDWGFQGFVVSDLGGIGTMVNGHQRGQGSLEDAVARAMNAGCDFSDREFATYAPAAVRDGLLPEARLDDAVTRLLRVRFRLGEFDPPARVPYSRISPSVIGSPAHRQLALQTAQEAIVLLTNAHHLLPLDRTKIRRIAVIGPHADLFTAGGYSGIPVNPITPLQGLKDRAAPGTQIDSVRGGEIVPGRGETEAEREDELRKAAVAARSADVAIVYVGTTLDIEAEGRDRTALGLPGNQEELVRTVLAANPRTVVVEMNAGPLTVPWVAAHAPAILEAWWDGEAGGDAIADVLFGTVNPSGHLPLTIYASAAQVPPQTEYDITQGFTYMYLKGKPLFPFGHGLSYTQFGYGPLRLSSTTVPGTGHVGVSVEIQNTGKVAGAEVVQLYVHTVHSDIPQPEEKLAGFQRVSLTPGQRRTVAFDLPTERLTFYDVVTHQFVVEPGEFEVRIGSSSGDIRAKGRLRVTTENSWKP